jgi:small GTP-binding protein
MEEEKPLTSECLMTGKEGKARKAMIKKLGDGIMDFGPKFKYIIVGSSGVGKTAILLRFCDSKFNDTHLVTIGVDFKTKFLCVGNSITKLQIWDTAGQEKFKSITRSYYKNSHACLAVYDVTNRDSFNLIKEYVEYYKTESESRIPSNIVLVGNKCDAERNR